MDNFEEYKKLGEPKKKEKSEIWQAAIGLQGVDGLTPSAYLIETAKENIDGKISFSEVKDRLNGYYKETSAKSADDRTEEADKVSARIAEILSEKTFSFSPAEYITIHKRLFTGIYPLAGQIRAYNISKDEWVLNGATVYYASADSIRAALEYDFGIEKAFDYKGLDKREIAFRIAKFISGIWQIHAFGEGNTRTTAVFAIKYLRTFGFTVENDLFAGNSWYFRNALVRTNYNDYERKTFATFEYLNRFFANLLLGGKFELKNRELKIPIGNTENKTLNKDINDTLNNSINNSENDTLNKNINDTLNDSINNSENDTLNKNINDTLNGVINDAVNTAAKNKNDTLKSKNNTVNAAKTVNSSAKSKKHTKNNIKKDKNTARNNTKKTTRKDTLNRAVLKLIEKNEKITAVLLAEKLKKGTATVKRQLKNLKENGYIERIGSDKTGSWKILKKK
ncbi:MAG: Fic family protein [Clostridiales bacterium]|jgi:fido (protein-threonine AMPylation protein)|nr:Fic family protein [Clostridiales bacterium]